MKYKILGPVYERYNPNIDEDCNGTIVSTEMNVSKSIKREVQIAILLYAGSFSHFMIENSFDKDPRYDKKKFPKINYKEKGVARRVIVAYCEAEGIPYDTDELELRVFNEI